MTWLLIGILIWIAVAIPVALLIGRSIRLADAKRAIAGEDVAAANFVATDVPVAAAAVEPEEQPWTGPATVPFAPSRLPWGGQRTSGRRAQPPLGTHAAPSEPSPSSTEPGRG